VNELIKFVTDVMRGTQMSPIYRAR